MPINARRLVASLEHFPEALAGTLRPWGARELEWKPADGSWSILEVLGHLADEEELDFPVRLRSTLETPEAIWAPIDPEGWVRERNHQAGKKSDLLALFTKRRNANVDWLYRLKDANWDQANVHPKFGSMRAGDLLVSWAAHDALHLRQIGKILWRLAVERDGEGEYVADYAGPRP